MDFNGFIQAPAIRKILDILTWFAQDSWDLRRQQALNAARVAYSSFGGTLTGSVVLNIPQAQASDQVFSFLVFTTDAGSGTGRYRIDSQNPNVSTSPPQGLPIFTGGYEITIQGHENIKGFRVMAESGQTLNYSYHLFQ